jgi:hypothetical protein
LPCFNDGRIEQVGAPAEVYEHPQSEFIAGFVGVSNVLERDGRRFTIRPEKIRLLDGPHDGLYTEAGVVRDVAYAGMVTRYVVDLDAGGELQVVRQTSRRHRRRRSSSEDEGSGSVGARSTPSRSQRRRSHEEGSMDGGLRDRSGAVARGGGLRGGDSGDSSSNGGVKAPKGPKALAKLGKGEGKVNLIAWAGYVEDGSTDPKVDWVSDFEKQTGCQVNVKVGNTSDEMVTLMRTGQYDGVSASG